MPHEPVRRWTGRRLLVPSVLLAAAVSLGALASSATASSVLPGSVPIAKESKRHHKKHHHHRAPVVHPPTVIPVAPPTTYDLKYADGLAAVTAWIHGIANQYRGGGIFYLVGTNPPCGFANYVNGTHSLVCFAYVEYPDPACLFGQTYAYDRYLVTAHLTSKYSYVVQTDGQLEDLAVCYA